MRLTILGSGTSHGIPVIACDCPVCASADRRDIRRRASLLVEGAAGETLVVDTGCDFRVQMLDARLKHIDAVFLTHTHADHLHGLDDIRPLSWAGAVPVYGNPLSIAELRSRFRYVFNKTQKGGGKPNIEPRRISKPVSVGGIMVRPVPVKHGCLTILGYTFTEQDRQAAYITDCSALPSAGLRTILPCQTLIIGALRSKPHPTHFTFDQAFELIRLVYETGGQTLRQAFFTHISHETSHVQIEELCTRYLSEHNLSGLTIAPAFDMLHIEC